MRIAIVVAVLALVACKKSSKQQAPTSASGSASAAPAALSDDAVTIQKPAPEGPYAVVHACSHEAEQWTSTTRVDLESGVATGDRQERKTPTDPVVTTAVPPTKIDNKRLDQLRVAFEEVLQGGPYEPERATAGGVECTFAIEAAGKVFFRIDKATNELDDAVNRLVGLM